MTDGSQKWKREAEQAKETMQPVTKPVEMGLEAALLVIRNGGFTAAAERSLTNILKGYSTERVSVVCRLDFIAATRTAGGRSLTFLRRVGPIGVNLARVSAVTMLAERVAKGEVAVDDLESEFERIRQLPSPYNRWVLIVAAAFTAACFSKIPGGDLGSLVISLVAAASGQFLRSLLQARKVALARVMLICGALSVMIASVGLSLGFSQVVPATLIASVIYMVPGLPLIKGFVDVASHKHLFVGIKRIANAALLFLALAVAIALTDMLVR